MKKILFAILSITSLFFATLLTHPVFAHGDEPRLEISLERVNPGGVIDVRGVDFEPEEAITLMLVNSGTAIPLGEMTADTDGIFLQIVEVPADLAEGTYNFLAITDDHNITSPDLIVQGPPVIAEGEGGQGPRDEDDGLLAPMPTYAPGVVPGGVSQPVAQPGPQETPASNPVPTLPILIAVLALGALILFSLRAVRRR